MWEQWGSLKDNKGEKIDKEKKKKKKKKEKRKKKFFPLIEKKS